MLRLIQLLIYGHIHKWATIDSRVLEGSYGARGHRYTLRCEKCGDIVKRDLL